MLQQYKKRMIAQRLREALNVAPVVVLAGARQTGKTTLLTHELPFKDWPFFSLDDPELLTLAKVSPRDVVNAHDKMIIDEVQKAPELLSYVKMAVDKDRSRVFVLSGSANLLLMKNVSESLAGRAIYLELMPFSLHEYLERPGHHWIAMAGERNFAEKLAGTEQCGEPLDSVLFRGLLPPATFLDKESNISLWWKGYIGTYLERDLRMLSQVGDIASFHQFMEILAHRTGRILKQSEAARDAGLSAASASRYVSLLETTGLYYRLRPFFANLTKRLIKAPKGFFLDTGLAGALAGFKTASSITPEFGAQLLETFVFHNLLGHVSHVGGKLCYFRTLGGKEIEVDFVIELDDGLVVLEVKYKKELTAKDVRPLIQFSDLTSGGKKILLKAIIYTGGDIKALPGGVLAIPWFVL
ncbi:MAG: hypothetical protein DRH20_12780 [Deltaproteobacteria bacterium]|nr:MAG: hypothetical protein DRH20_12780 [Deltaproteobacteria bacterium]